MAKRLRDVHVDRVYKLYRRTNSLIASLTADDVLTKVERGSLQIAQRMLAHAHDEMQARVVKQATL